MARRKIKRYELEMTSDIVTDITCVMGVALFVRIAYFFGFSRLENAGFLHLTFGLILPLLLESAFIVLMRGMSFQNTQLYILMGVGLCLMMFWQCFRYDNILRMILGFTAYLSCGAAMFALTKGMLSEKIVKWMLLGVALGRLVLFNIVQNLLGLHLISLMFEATAILDLIALYKFAGALKLKK